MVLADFSGTLPGQPQPRIRRGATAAAVVAALAVACLAAVAVFSASKGAVALADTQDVADAALNAEQTLNAGIAKLGSGAGSLQNKALASQMKQALSAVQELKGQLPTAAAADAAYAGAPAGASGRAAGARGRVARLHAAAAAAHADANDVVRKNLAKVRITAQHGETDDAILSGDLPTSDYRQVRDELRKMVEVAKRLSGEVKAMPTASARAAALVQRKLGSVAHAARAMKRAAGEVDAARKRVVAHELEVRKQKLAEAEEEEMAAMRAAKEAIAAEEEAVQKRKEAAADEAAARERRIAARRARAIAARGEEGEKAMKEAAGSVFPKRPDLKETILGGAAETAAGEQGDQTPSKSAVASECVDTLAKYGCEGLMANNPCVAFCGTDNDVRRSARSKRAASAVQVHDRTGYFASDQGRDTYVDSVYGKYDPSTYSHQRTGWFVSKAAKRAARLAPEVETGGFSDVAADGQDLTDEQHAENLGSAQQVLRHEEALKRRLQGSLEQEEAQNKELQQRVARQESALRLVVVSSLVLV